MIADYLEWMPVSTYMMTMDPQSAVDVAEYLTANPEQI